MPCSAPALPAADLGEYRGLMIVNVKMIKTSITEDGSCASKAISWPAEEGRKCCPSVSLYRSLGQLGSQKHLTVAGLPV